MLDIKELNKSVSFPNFSQVVDNEDLLYSNSKLSTLQLNIGRICNMSCKHCHVNSSPNRKEMMNLETMKACVDFCRKYGFKTVDITGGAPEMVAGIEWLIEELSKIVDHIIVRSNLTILYTKKYEHMIDVYKKYRVNLVCSLPFYSKNSTDRVRGEGVFDTSIKVLKKLNKAGYGIDDELELDLVYNPSGAFLPASQEQLEKVYKERLYNSYGIVFNYLYTIINNPIGRFSDFLNESGNLQSYMYELFYSFNPDNVENIMCRSQISVDYDGRLYDCDFNLAANIPISKKLTIFEVLEKGLNKRKIVTGKHCFACTAGFGSS